MIEERVFGMQKWVYEAALPDLVLSAAVAAETLLGYSLRQRTQEISILASQRKSHPVTLQILARRTSSAGAEFKGFTIRIRKDIVHCFAIV